MHKHHAARGAATAGLAVAVVAAMTGFSPGASAAAPRHPLARSAPSWLGHAHRVGAADAHAPQAVRVYLAPRGGLTALQSAVAAVSTPGSADYHHFLTADQYFAAYAPTSADTAAVVDWLRGAGLRVTGTDPHGRYLDATGPATAAEAAFGVGLATYTHDGQTVSAPSGTLSVPGALADTVLAVSGLDTTAQQARTQTVADSGGTAADLTGAQRAAKAAPDAAPPAAFVNARPCSTYYGQVAAKYQADYATPLPTFGGKTLPYAVCGYTGPQFRAAYEGGSALTGAGVTVGIIDAYAAPTIAADANTYATNHGDGGYGSGQLTQTTLTPFNSQKACGPSGWYGEETLDVEAVHAMAPDAGIHYYGASSCNDTDLLAAQRQAVDDNKVQLVTNSYGNAGEQGESADAVVASEQVLMQGAMEGISFLFSSGDSGDEVANTGLKQVDYEASDPYVTAVGGTSTAINGSGAIAFQTGWGTDKYSLSSDGTSWNPLGYLYGAGGGYSTLFNRPSYQDGVVPSTSAGRGVPDVAMDADPNTGMLVGETQTFPNHKVAYGEYRIGGTSLASPLMAGMLALRDQQQGTSTGFLNPTLYSNAKAFTDVKGTPKDAGNVRVDYRNGVDASNGLAYSVRTFNQDASLTVTKGWDDVTGLGVPTAALFATP